MQHPITVNRPLFSVEIIPIFYLHDQRIMANADLMLTPCIAHRAPCGQLAHLRDAPSHLVC